MTGIVVVSHPLSDALEEECEKNNHLADKLEMLRRQQSSLESDVGRSEAMRREREGADSRFIKVNTGTPCHASADDFVLHYVMVTRLFLNQSCLLLGCVGGASK